MMKKKPEILDSKIIASSRLFTIEQMSLEFSNGEQRDYERIIAPGAGAVLIVPVASKSQVLMIREYSAGTHRYELLFPKGKIDAGEDFMAAANRELMEELGYAAGRLSHIHSMTIAPGYLDFTTHIILAEELYQQKLEGDEPEPLEIVTCELNHFNDLLKNPELTEARSIAALYMARDYLMMQQ
ncbi:MAG: ADP compounds hydrolase NudE [Gammaproteobacteria bacterium]|nr:ADP compounds hydrolase NudE [Gammaproteobacteria bacterium]